MTDDYSELPQEIQREILENVGKKEYTMSEIVEIKKIIEKSRTGHRPNKGTKLSPFFKGKSVDVTARIAGFSRGTIQKMIDIVESGDQKLIDSVNSGKTKVHTAHIMLNRRIRNNMPTVNLPEGEFELIYADPPWQYDVELKGATPYKTRTLEELIAEFPTIPAYKDSLLFLWATNPKLDEAMDLMKFWGFTYVTCIIWVKQKDGKLQVGMGHHTRSANELLLIGKKGAPGTPTEDVRPPSVIFAERTIHSKKPEIFYEIIEKMHPAKKKLEMFARQERKGWTYHGNQVTKLAKSGEEK